MSKQSPNIEMGAHFERALKVLAAVGRLKSGGTATDVREAFCDIHGEPIGVMTVRRNLAFLLAVGRVRCDFDGSAYWWTCVPEGK